MFVGVSMAPAARASERRGSLLVRRSIVAAHATEEAETSSNSGAWQPPDSILEVEPSACSAPGNALAMLCKQCWLHIHTVTYR